MRPEIIEKLKKENEEVYNSVRELTLYLPDIIDNNAPSEEGETRETSKVIVIDLL